MSSVNLKLDAGTAEMPKNPQLTPEVAYDWRLMRHSDAGQGTIKAHDAQATDIYISGNRQLQGDLLYRTYLPVPGGFISQWSNGGQNMWRAYLERAQYPSIISPAVNSMVGIIHKTEWRIELPAAMEYLYEAATESGRSLESFSREITRELLLMGRFSIIADRPAEGGEPYLVGQKAEALVNWDTDFYIFDESGYVRDGMDWNPVVRFREYGLDEAGRYYQILLDESLEPIDDAIYPAGPAGQALDFVPVVVVGTRDVSQDIENPPLVGAANAALSLYRLDADYRHQLYMSGQETLVVDNGEAPEAIGPSVTLELTSTSENPASVYYVSPTCSGITAHREAIETEWENAAKAGAKLFDSGAAQESGEARRMRQNAETATLQTIANSGAEALEMALKNVAVMVGSDPDEVVVTPPRDLLDSPMSMRDVLDAVKAWREGGYSYQTLYENLQRGQIASDERTADDELSLMNTDFADADPSVI